MDDKCTIRERLLVIFPETKKIFFWVFAIIAAIAVIANILAIKSIIYRKCKVLQKTCIISLALSDLLSVGSFTLNVMHTFSNELMIWTLGGILCFLLPTLQLFSTTMSSVALLVIALDRYLNVIHAMSKQWDPSIYLCLIGAVGLWILFGFVAFPMHKFFQYAPLTITNCTDNTTIEVYVCVSPKEPVKSFYLILTIFIFVPLLLVFLWFYFNIAKLIWKHRKPLSDRFDNNNSSRTQETSENDTATTNINSTKTSQAPKKNKVPIKKNVQMERKIRTFKIILVLMFVFLICKMPYWCNFNFKLFYDFGEMSQAKKILVWNLNYGLMALHMANCALNPFLYTFINQTVEFLKKFSKCVCRICFGDFDEFENENPFVIEQNKRKRSEKIPDLRY